MAAIGDESHLGDGLCVVFICVYELFRNEVLGFVVAGQLDV